MQRPALRFARLTLSTLAVAALCLGGCTASDDNNDDEPDRVGAGLDQEPDFTGVMEPDASPEPDAEPDTSPEPDAEPDASPEPDAEPDTSPEPDAEPDAEPDLCIDGPSKGLPSSSNVYYGTDTPDYLTTMTAAQMLAIGNFGFCTGTVITDEWVLSAEHCDLSPGDQFCVGAQPGNPNICFTIVEAINEPSGGDMALARLDVPYSVRAPNLEPIRILEENLHQGWVGQWAEAAGYGQQEDGSSDRREFTDEIIVEVGNDKLSIDGQGQSGVCWGDSGGPVMVYDGNGEIRVAGALSWGDPSCVDVDRYTRVDLYYDWIVSVAGPPAPTGPVPCGTVSTLGSCDIPAGRATYCGADGNLVVESCSGGEVCGFDDGEGGWRCMNAAADPCSGDGTFGSCNGGVLSWCTGEGVPQQRDCGACGESCQLIDDDFGYSCKVSQCGDIDYTGTCQGDTAVWCNNSDELSSENCASQGKVCGWHSDDYGYWCIDPPPVGCGDIDYFGTCEGDTAVWCSQSGELSSENCAQSGQSCGYVNDNIGYYCQ